MPNTEVNADSGDYTGTFPPFPGLAAGASHWRELVDSRTGSRLLNYRRFRLFKQVPGGPHYANTPASGGAQWPVGYQWMQSAN